MWRVDWRVTKRQFNRTKLLWVQSPYISEESSLVYQAQFSLNIVHKRGLKHHHFTGLPERVTVCVSGLSGKPSPDTGLRSIPGGGGGGGLENWNKHRPGRMREGVSPSRKVVWVQSETF